MGSVMSETECPNCLKEAMEDYYYKTGEIYVDCRNCGYHYSSTIINRDKKLNELTDDDWKIEELKEPYAAYTIKFRDSIAYHCGALIDKSNQDEMIKELKARTDVISMTTSQAIKNGDEVNIIVTEWIDEGPEYDSAGLNKNERKKL